MSFLPPAVTAVPGLPAATARGVDSGSQVAAGLEGKAPVPARVDTAEEAPMVMKLTGGCWAHALPAAGLRCAAVC